MIRRFFILMIFLLLGCNYGHERDNPNDPGAGDNYKGSSSSIIDDKSSSSGNGKSTSTPQPAPQPAW